MNLRKNTPKLHYSTYLLIFNPNRLSYCVFSLLNLSVKGPYSKIIPMEIFADTTDYFENDEMVRESYENASLRYREKYERMKTPSGKRLELLVSVLLNRALSSYGLSEKDMLYLENDNGKPFFKAYPEILFSVSHSGNAAVVAMERASDSAFSSSGLRFKKTPDHITLLGIDIEKLRTDISQNEKIAGRFFTPDEAIYLSSLNTDKKAYAFTDIWTKKEAYIKAIGTGLTTELDSFNVLKDIPGFTFKTHDLIPDYIITSCVKK